MQWLVNIDEAVADGVIDADAGEALKKRGREGMISYAIGLALSIGVVMVIGGLSLLLQDARALTALGAVLTGLGVWGLLQDASRRLALLANAAAVIGAALALGSGAYWISLGWAQPLWLGFALGAPTIALGLWLQNSGPPALETFARWLILLGASVHVTGLMSHPSDGGYAWLALHYVAAVSVALGAHLNVRFLTAIAIIPLATALSSKTF